MEFVAQEIVLAEGKRYEDQAQLQEAVREKQD